jgi:uncharacterized protein with HEPN domain
MIDEIDFVLQTTSGKNKNEVIDDAILSRAVIRSLEIIGEATTKIDEEFKAHHPHIEWKKIAGTRHRLIHDYFGVDYDIVWDIIINKLPQLQSFLKDMVKE